MIRAVLLDRDGVINFDSDSCICSPQQWQPIPGSLEAIAMLNKQGLAIGVATNQRAIARGLLDQATLAQIHHKMYALLADVHGSIDALRYCPHDYHDNCLCRKPKPGMLLRLLEVLEISPQHACMIGDKIDDIRAARAAGVEPILVLTGKGEATMMHHREEIGNALIYPDLAAATIAIRHRV